MRPSRLDLTMGKKWSVTTQSKWSFTFALVVMFCVIVPLAVMFWLLYACYKLVLTALNWINPKGEE